MWSRSGAPGDRNTYSAGMIELIAELVAGPGAISPEEAGDWLADLIARGEDYFVSVNHYLFTLTRGP